MARKYFGTDGIRGKANIFPMTPDFAMKVGIAVGVLFRSKATSRRVVIGKDTRLSCYMLENALVAGFTAAGMDAFLLGPIPTPAVAMLCRSLRADIGVMISASHNAFYDNGIKLFGPDGFKLSDEKETKIEALLDSDISELPLANCEEIGRAKRVEGDIYRYIEYAKRTLPRDVRLDALRIVVDCANGATYKAAPRALWELGAEVIAINDEPNGFNINQECGSTDLTSLRNKVHEVRADVGIALDGDGDRVLMVDEKGQMIDGDQLIAVIAEHWHKTGRLHHKGIVTTVMSNLGLERFLSEKGLKLIRTDVGDRYVVDMMRQKKYNIGGESSGHIILSDFCTTGDGLVAALQVLACMKESQQPMSQLCKRFEPVPQILKNKVVHNKNVLQKSEVQAALTKASEHLGKEGRLLVRASGTEPVIRVMAEGDDRKAMTAIVDDLITLIARHDHD
ncbi:phosphoglucosamine mutase [Bartonella bacilliformis Peru38]|uniref:Phosphoglucosamine mutase n=2 Tax=Bartonella bacilliformis TaxID=774 RepID=GLMM_BARBK|nr:phosphoglucosamine mutase [Bartonella bacilliformis]A1URA6.1 RecName: Full=Phosphoglucosamine mutase [Bartonella bacilliformis KC583]ABM45449.1 phosphoglucosamine mutase [Bartonella bacilliformis KC583]AMG85388.1 phosphoglucosamine mutase [Bartonella bacilliformis]EKS46060.1 phosphoglucosamine mutase [Bartonella bacilliformis INS]EYS89174.1 phosphoglucosamine mutase [Bartonella bacilliformis San Pedro600-02]EYS94121.1 phosphoglucosamine mutase [Bartonella bacilliformis Peru-18]